MFACYVVLLFFTVLRYKIHYTLCKSMNIIIRNKQIDLILPVYTILIFRSLFLLSLSRIPSFVFAKLSYNGGSEKATSWQACHIYERIIAWNKQKTSIKCKHKITTV